MKLINILETANNQSNIVIEEIFETFSYTSKLLGSNISFLYTNEYITSIFSNCSSRDNLIVYIDYEGESKVIFRDINSITNNLSESFDDENTYTFRIEISKNIVNNEISIYSSVDFIKWLKNYENLNQCYTKYEPIFSIQGQVYLELLDGKELNLSTKKMTFLKQNECSVVLDRDKILEQRKDYCFVSGDNVPKIVPEDFFILNESNDEELNLLFNKLCLLSILTFIADISEFKDDCLNYKLYGYKTIKDSFTLENIETSNLIQLFKIYTWIYHDENHSSISDKLGITRNLLTLHMKENTFNKIEGDVYTAIKSNFDIYLKENVQRYLEVKNQVSAFIHDMSVKAESHSENFVETMKKSLLIFLSYFLSIIIVTAIDKGKFINVFTFEVTTITMVMLIISWIYRKNTISEIKCKTKRFKEKYSNFKERYSDILEAQHITALFSNDKDHNSDIQYIEDTIRRYDPLWKISILVFGIISIFFCFYHDSSTVFEKLIQVIFFILGLMN
jgi:hypothetical protein